MTFFERIFAFHVMLNKKLDPGTLTPAWAACLGITMLAMLNIWFISDVVALLVRDRRLMFPHEKLGAYGVAIVLVAFFWAFYGRARRSGPLMHRIARFSEQERRRTWVIGSIYAVLSLGTCAAGLILVVNYTP